MTFDSRAADVVGSSFGARVLFAAARLTQGDLSEFHGLPVRYLDCCLVFSRENISHCPRSALVEIFGEMSLEHLAAAAQQIEAIACPSDPADLEICFFLMNHIALTGEYPLPELYICAAMHLL
jgi:hypothetical protein